MLEYTIKLEQFEGPLDLLLKLIDKQELDISKVSLAMVTEQYIEYVQRKEEKLNPEGLADFLIVATRLLLIKSKGLLPQVDFGEEDSADELEKQLKMYKEFLAGSEKIEAIMAKNKFGFFREKSPRELDSIFNPPKNVDVNVLATVFKEIIGGLEMIPKLKQKGIERVISIKEKILYISNIIFERTELSFNELIDQTKDRVGVIVSFLAILELVKQGRAMVVQDGTFSEIRVCRVKDLTGTK